MQKDSKECDNLIGKHKRTKLYNSFNLMVLINNFYSITPDQTKDSEAKTINLYSCTAEGCLQIHGTKVKAHQKIKTIQFIHQDKINLTKNLHLVTCEEQRKLFKGL